MDAKTCLSSKGQLIIPKIMRDTLGLHLGSQLALHLREDKVIELRILQKNLQQFFGQGKRTGHKKPMTIAEMDQAIMHGVLEHD